MLAIVNAEVRTCGPQGTIPNGSVLVDGGKILAVGHSLGIPDGAQVIDATGLVVTPGLIDAHTHLGTNFQVTPAGGDSESNEGASANNAHVRALDTVNTSDPHFRDAVEAGVTTVMIHCGGPLSLRGLSPVTGQSFIMKTSGAARRREILREPAAMKFALGDEVMRTLNDRKNGPNSRAGVIALLRAALSDARSRSQAGSPAAGKRDLRSEALGKVISGELPLHVHALKVIDIRSALGLAQEYGLGIVLHHATEGHLMADEIAARGVTCVLGPISRATVPLGESQRASLTGPAILVNAGVKVALMTDHPAVSVQHLAMSAGEAVLAGLTPDAALRAITINPAQMLGVDGRVGSIEPGKDADLVIHGGDPLAATTGVRLVVAGGEIVFTRL